MLPAPSPPIVIRVFSTHFDPAFVTCSPETTIRWLIMPVREQNSHSLYYNTTQGHVIGFEQIDVESPYLETNKTFELTFHRPGIYNYRCLIFGGLEGCVEVLSSDEFGVDREDIRRVKGIDKKNVASICSICSIGASTDIEKVTASEDAPKDEAAEMKSIQKIIEKYLKGAKWELPVEIALEMDKIEDEIPFYSEEKKKSAKRKRTRNARRRYKAKRHAFMEFWKDESKVFQEVIRSEFKDIWNRRRDILANKDNQASSSRAAAIEACMNLSC